MNLTIAGGLYGEFCAIPSTQELFGPGGRAAAALSNRKVQISLYSYFPKKEIIEAEFLARNFGFQFIPFECSERTSFSYLHLLSVPQIFPSPMPSNRPIEVEAENIIRYGFIEGDAIVHGSNQVVFDPQDAINPKSFTANGSKANRLAVVCNLSEAEKLTKKTEKREIIDAVIAQDQAEVVVLKCGGDGCYVQAGGTFTHIPPHPTQNVHKMGSGDVFTAEFAYGWIVLELDADAAARRASLQTAHYCHFHTLPLKQDIKADDIPPVEYPSLEQGKKYDVYLAGPFFSLSQRWMIEETRNQLRIMGLRVFSPIHDVGDGPPKIVAKQDLDALHESRFVFACLDGFDPGTVFEIGYAHSNEIPILAYGQNLPHRDLDMFIGTDCTIINDFVSAIYRAAFWKNSND